MTDLKRYLQMLQDWDVQYEQELEEDRTTITLWSEDRKVRGFCGFYCAAYFEVGTDKFISFGIYE